MAEETKVFKEYGVSGAAQWALSGEEPETETALQGSAGIEVWQDMRMSDHTAGAILAALTLPIRRSVWSAEPASSKPADQEAAEFLEQAMNDMSHSWSAMILDAMTFFPFGWSWLEQVMKKRQGLTPSGRDTAKSKYIDNRIGWRKISLRPQTTIDGWQIDEHGGIQALLQTIPKKTEPVTIPIQRSLLFRTTTEGNHPEGLSIFRQAWRPWMHRKRLEMVEGMAFTRNLAGILKTHLGPGATTIADEAQESDEYKAKQMIKDAYDDRLVGIIETENVAVSVLEGPKGTNFTAISRAITRKDTEMARSVLAHFIMLALQERGSYGLAKDESDLFLMAVMAYLEGMTDIIQRFAVERLFRLNVFPNITDLPQIKATAVYKPDIGDLADAVNDLVQAEVLTIDDTLEAYIRSVANLPELPADLTRSSREEEIGVREPDQPPARPDQPETPEGGAADEGDEEHASERFARRPAKKRLYTKSTTAYENDLQGIYRDWAADTAEELGGLGPDTTEEELWPHLDDWLAVGVLLLMEKGYHDLMAAFILGFGSPSIGPDGLRIVEDAMTKNDSYLAGSLFEDIRGRLEGEIAAILLLLKHGRPGDAQRHLETTLLSLEYRLPLYGGTYWEMIHEGAGFRLTERGTVAGPGVRWVLDPLAAHCTTCPPKAKTYSSWGAMVAECNGVPGAGQDECDGRCRCWVEELTAGGFWIWA